MKDYVLPLGGGNEIGASCYLLQIGAARLLIDAGMRMHASTVFPSFAPLYEMIGGLEALDGLLITHAHLDHCGALTRVHYEAPRVPKFASAPTADLMAVMLGDALKAGNQRTHEDYAVVESTRDVLAGALDSIQVVERGRPIEQLPGQALALPAGHILGACSYLLELGGRRILHTGDFSLERQHAVAGAELMEQVDQVDVLIMESTYAYQPHPREESIQEQQFELAQFLGGVVGQGGRVLLPSFALGRAQEIAALLADLFEQGVLPPFPVWVDGLVKPICDVYDRHRAWLAGRRATSPGHAIYDQWVRPAPPYFVSHADVAGMEPCCIISSSGMLQDGTRSALYAEQLLPGAGNALAFSGYLDIESPGRRVGDLAQARTSRINGQQVDVRARLHRYHLSAHAHPGDLRRVILKLKPKTLILIHGDYEYDGSPDFLDFLFALERHGTQVHQASNGVPIYL